jgi:hypothetical protein
MVAFEMTCQMDERAAPVRGMMIIDTMVPRQSYRPMPPIAPLRMLAEDALRLELGVDELVVLQADEPCTVATFEDLADSFHRLSLATEDIHVIIPGRYRTLFLQGDFA